MELILEIKKKSWYGEEHMAAQCTCETFQLPKYSYEKEAMYHTIHNPQCQIHKKLKHKTNDNINIHFN